MEIAAPVAVIPHADHPTSSFKSDAQKTALLSALSQLAQTTVTAPVATSASLLSTLLKALQASASQQGGIAPLLTDLKHAQIAADIPVPVRQAITQTLQITAPLSHLSTDVEINTALLKFEQPRPPLNPAQPQTLNAPPTQATNTVLVADIKFALETLQETLKSWSTSQSLSPSVTPQANSSNPSPQPSSSQIATPSTQQAPTPTAPISLGAPHSSPQPSLQATILPGPAIATQSHSPTQPSATTAGPPAPSARVATTAAIPQSPVAVAPPPQADQIASLLLLQQATSSSSTQVTRQKPAKPEQSTAKEAANPELALALSTAAYRKSQGGAPPPAPTHWPQNPDATFIAKTLASKTEAALTQVKIIEASAQLQRADAAPPTTAQEPRWAFELPLATPFGQTAVKFEVSRDTYKTRSNAHAIVWRAHFSIDVEPLGPIQAQIALLEKNAWVSIWAERESSMKLLEAQQPLLHQTFRDEDLAAEVICCLGVPTHHTPGTGKLMDSAV